MKPAPSLPALFLSTIKKLPPQPANLRLAVSGGALAPEPPRATRNTPEFIRNLLKNTLFFSFFRVPPGMTWDEAELEKKFGFSRLNSKKKWSENCAKIWWAKKIWVQPAEPTPHRNSNFAAKI